jgi:hypothetical protein
MMLVIINFHIERTYMSMNLYCRHFLNEQIQNLGSIKHSMPSKGYVNEQPQSDTSGATF